MSASGSPSKACTRCESVKPLTEFYRCAKAADGRTWECGECARAQRRRHGQANRAAETASRLKWREANRDKDAASMRSWRAANAERVRESTRRWEIENRDRLAAAKRAWYEANREDVLARHRSNVDGRRASGGRYREAHRDVLAERQRQRRVDNLGLKVQDVDLAALWTGVCGICRDILDLDLAWPDPRSKSVDHLVPLARGGTHEQSNLQWAHLSCNVRKGARMPDDVGGGE